MKFRPVISSKEILIGSPLGAVEITVFGDYESEETYKLNDVVKQLLKDFAGEICFVFRHFPLTQIHPKAHKAAEAAIAAGQEGRFWDMHQYLLANYQNLDVASLKQYAQEVGLSNILFFEQLMKGYYNWHVQEDLREGLSMGVAKIPTLFINGYLFDQQLSLTNLTNEIKKRIEEKKPFRNTH